MHSLATSFLLTRSYSLRKDNLPMNHKVILAMLCITALAITAMATHTNGVILGAAIAAIAGLGGFAFKKITKKE
jgi:hypothetical protein